MRKTVLITGTSSGIGNAAVKHFSDNDWNVAATMRNPSSEAGKKISQLPNTLVLPLDVTDRDAIRSAVDATIAKFGGLDALVNNAGYGLAGPMELATPSQIEKQYKTNVFGPIYTMQAVLPHMRAKGSGVIVNVTSVGGKVALPFNSLYHGTKFGLEGISESASLELAPLGIRVRIVEPGGVKTDFAGRSLVMTSSESIKAYDTMISNALTVFGNTTGASEPEVIAKVVFEAVTDESDKIRFPAGEDAKVMLKERHESSDEDHQKKMMSHYKLLE